MEIDDSQKKMKNIVMKYKNINTSILEKVIRKIKERNKPTIIVGKREKWERER